MNLESQVTSLELSKRLHELGVKQESFFCWLFRYDKFVLDFNCNSKSYELIYSAFTASELLELLPKQISKNINLLFLSIYPCGDEYMVRYINDCYRDTFIYDDFFTKDNNICNALAKMLIHLIENLCYNIPLNTKD